MRFLVFAIAALPLVAASTAIQDVTLIDVASGTARPHMTVVIDDGKISRVGVATSIQLPATARIVSGKDKFLMPGLWDMHVHLYYKQYLPLFVAFGITGVQDMGSDFSKVSAWRDEIDVHFIKLIERLARLVRVTSDEQRKLRIDRRSPIDWRSAGDDVRPHRDALFDLMDGRN